MIDATIHAGDCRDWLPGLQPGSADAVVTDPPYGLNFMGKGWDAGVPGRDFWLRVLPALRPGGYMLAMGGTRTYHRLACAIEDAGFEIRDCLMWVYGTGFPKGNGCLKPAWEPIILARRPGPKVLPLGIDGCRVPVAGTRPVFVKRNESSVGCYGDGLNGCNRTGETTSLGRYPANVVLSDDAEVTEAFAAADSPAARYRPRKGDGIGRGYGGSTAHHDTARGFADAGSRARFFYCAKASKAERGEGNTHPTVKPLALMRWLVRLVCPPGGLVADPFAGSGSTLLAALMEVRRATGCELDPEYARIANARLAAYNPAG